jgi:Cof subfamily protein (haloacid dehalogenase superfamily)
MKLVVADLDGTLLNKGFTNETLNTVKKLQDEGYIFTIATGRHFSIAKKYVKELNVKYPAIYSNGAHIYDMENDKIIYQAFIQEQAALQTIGICNDFNIDFIVYTVDHVYSTKHARDKLIARVGNYDIDVLDDDELKLCVKKGVVKILIFDDEKESIIKIRKVLNLENDICAVQSHPNYLEVSDHLVNKGNALRILAEYLKIELKDCLAIGDQENDIKMIQVAGIGVAIGNGNPLLLKEADYITKSFEENGFSYAVSDLIFKDNNK